MEKMLNWICLLFALVPIVRSTDFITCERDYDKMGCVEEGHTHMDLIVYDRYAIDWKRFPESVHSLVCRCSEKGRLEGYTYFSIRFWAECWAGKNKSDINVVLGDGSKAATNCAGYDFKTCKDGIEEECVGTKFSEYIYSIKPQVDGGFTDWSPFEECSRPCAGGNQTRSRSCTNPKPKYGGKDCVGAEVESRVCNTRPCPVDGGLSNWSNYTSCSVSCGGGNQTRTRSCTNPPPAHHGRPCHGALKEQKLCNSQQCPVDGGLSSWSSFTRCSKSCGGGYQRRSRRCSNPPPSHGGKDCSGVHNEMRRCNMQKCECRNYRFLGRRRSCHSNVYTYVRGRCDGWQRVGLEECKRKCNRNEAPGGCPRRPCKYVIWDINPGALPGWCQLATDGCRIGGANNGHHLFVKQC